MLKVVFCVRVCFVYVYLSHTVCVCVSVSVWLAVYVFVCLKGRIHWFVGTYLWVKYRDLLFWQLKIFFRPCEARDRGWGISLWDGVFPYDQGDFPMISMGDFPMIRGQSSWPEYLTKKNSKFSFGILGFP